MSHFSRLITAVATAMMLSNAHASQSVDLGIASQFSALTFGSFTGYSGDTGSLLAVGGNATLTNWTVNDYGTAGYGQIDQALIVGGSLNATSGKLFGMTTSAGTVLGQAYVQGTSTLSSFAVGSVVGGPSPLNFEMLQSQLSGTSTATSQLAATGSVSYAGGSTQLMGSNRAVEVFNIDGAELSQDTFLGSLGGLQSGATVILNVSGADVKMEHFGVNLGTYAQPLNLLVNFYQATSLSFASMALEGAVLAPWAHVTGTDGHIGGTFIANSFSSVDVGNFEFHDLSFTPVIVPSPVPEPQTWLMLGVGLLAVAGARRGKRRAC